MRLSEFVIIYLAAAAPFGVAYVLRRRGREGWRPRSYAKAAAAALAWPALLALRLTRGADAAEGAPPPESLDEALVERAKRETILWLRRAEDDFCASSPMAGEEARHHFFAAREYAERYAGLALASAGARADETPSEREMELCRIAGRGGDDLLLAGLCVHRRNVTRLLAHRERARAQFERALAHLCCAEGGPSGALAEALAGASALFSALGDADAAGRTARLAAAARLRLSEPEAAPGVRPDEGPSRPTKGERPCTTQAARGAFANPPQSTTTFTRG